MGQIAVDVVLLPDGEMTTRAIEINRQLAAPGRPEIVLGRQERLPHISLAMGGVEDANVQSIEECLEGIARQVPVRTLRAVGLTASVNARGETTCLLDIERTPQLQALHERVMLEMKSFFSYDVNAALFRDDAINPSTLEWVRTYPQKAAYENFHPHITLGYGQTPPDLSFPIPFTVAQLALCHLGNHCTCRKVLATAHVAWASRP